MVQVKDSYGMKDGEGYTMKRLIFRIGGERFPTVYKSTVVQKQMGILIGIT